MWHGQHLISIDYFPFSPDYAITHRESLQTTCLACSHGLSTIVVYGKDMIILDRTELKSTMCRRLIYLRKPFSSIMDNIIFVKKMEVDAVFVYLNPAE